MSESKKEFEMPVECPLCHKTVEFSETKIYDVKKTADGEAELLVCCEECHKQTESKK